MKRLRSTSSAGRLERGFRAVLDHCAALFPALRRVRLRFCRDADRAHRRKWRLFAHANHHPWTVCFARAAERELTDLEILGMSAHEIGHVVGDYLGTPAHRRFSGGGGKTPQAVQDEADAIAGEMFGLEIRYNRRTLQELVRVPPALDRL